MDFVVSLVGLGAGGGGVLGMHVSNVYHCCVGTDLVTFLAGT